MTDNDELPPSPPNLDPKPWMSADGKRWKTNVHGRATFFPGWDYEQDKSKYERQPSYGTGTGTMVM
jgi:hypothetical protein